MSFKRLIIGRAREFHHLLRATCSDYHCPPPRQVDLELSNRCNLHCKMCWFHGERGVGDRYQGQELTSSEVFHLIDQLASYNPALQIYLGGGEPYMRADFEDVLRYIKSSQLSVSFTTNGTLLDAERIRTLSAIGVDYINFSIDGFQELHDEQRGTGAFEKVTRSVRELSESRAGQGSAKPVITVNITVTASLAGHLKETVQAIRKATSDGADFYRIHHQWYLSPEELSEHQSVLKETLACQASGAAAHLVGSSGIADPPALADEIDAVRCEPKIIMFPDLGHRDIIDYYSDRPRNGKRCLAPLQGAVIRPNGDVMFCPDGWIDDYLLGNVRDQSFREIWNNEKARKFRGALIRNKRFPGCKRCSWMYAYQW